MSASMLKDSSIVIEGNRFTSIGMGAVYEGTLELDASARPAQINMKFDAGPEKGNTNLGIYELSGDTLKLCLATRELVRPSRFVATAGTGFALQTLVRGKAEQTRRAKRPIPETSAPKSGTPGTGLEGEWSMVSGMMSGKPMEDSLLQWVKRVTKGDHTTVYAGPQIMLQVKFTSDASKSPKTIDYLNLAGSHKGKRQSGIYEMEGDVLTVCMSAPGAARPDAFQSTPGDGRSLTVWKRA
jgi:uncharacterized protein (TIGR03067 family)